MNKHLSLLLLPGIFLAFSCRAPEPRAEAINRAEEIVSAFYDTAGIPGLAVAVSVNGERVWSQGFGYADLEHRVPVDPGTTLFRVGSVSKSFTSAAMARLVDKGQISPDSLVQVYVPSFPWKNDSITLRMVAGHLAGIRHYRGDEFMNNRFYPSVDEGLSIFITDSLLFRPGTRYSYSSYGYNLLSATLEKAAGKDFLTLMEEEVFGPAGMEHTLPDYSDSIITGRTDFYVTDSLERIVHAPDVDNSYKWAGGGFLSTAEDLLCFARAVQTDSFISRPVLEEFIRSQATSDGEPTHYGLGWATRTNALGMPWFGHSGGSIGGTTQLIIYPEQQVAVAMVCNLSDAPYGDIHHRLACLFIPEGPALPAYDTLLTAEWKGKYRVMDSPVEFELRQTPEGLAMVSGKRSTLLFPQGDTLFLSLDGTTTYPTILPDSTNRGLVLERGRLVYRALKQEE
ncbi:MAG TPA: class A beta-lactamase-related serine hydrolase [Bacteroidetes bacterium]|nr:class A beta-lactamase-related serine hydrolase [Bacteroidota bacterium]